MVAAGNSKQMALTSAAKVRVRRDAHQFSGAAAANFARAAAPDNPNQGMQTTVENLQGRLRYDYFFAKHWSLFLGVSGSDAIASRALTCVSTSIPAWRTT